MKKLLLEEQNWNSIETQSLQEFYPHEPSNVRESYFSSPVEFKSNKKTGFASIRHTTASLNLFTRKTLC